MDSQTKTDLIAAGAALDTAITALGAAWTDLLEARDGDPVLVGQITNLRVLVRMRLNHAGLAAVLKLRTPPATSAHTIASIEDALTSILENY